MFEPAFTLLGSPVSWLELFAFVLTVAMVICNVHEIHWGWPLSLVASLLYARLFFEHQLYGETGINLVFALAALWGWWQWLFGRAQRVEDLLAAPKGALGIARLPRGLRLGALAFWLIGWFVLGQFLARETDSDVPWADAFVTAGSMLGLTLTGRKFIENWPVWFVVNVASVVLFIYKALFLTALLYTLLAVMALWGWQSWRARAGLGK